MHPAHLRAERRRVALYGVTLPLVFLAGLLIALNGGVSLGLLLSMAVLIIYTLSWLRTVQGLNRNGLPVGKAAHHAVFLTLSKFPNLIGVLTFHSRRLRQREMRLIEYK
tara:strand:- start:121 stop:447 length:327 start_codon:yes stop_codon:yes gene_type:complete